MTSFNGYSQLLRFQTAKVSLFPSILAIVVSLAGGCVAALGSATASWIAYAGVIMLGAVLVYVQRRLVIAATSRARACLNRPLTGVERAAVWAILLGCLPNAVVIALSLSRITGAA